MRSTDWSGIARSSSRQSPRTMLSRAFSVKVKLPSLVPCSVRDPADSRLADTPTLVISSEATALAAVTSTTSARLRPVISAAHLPIRGWVWPALSAGSRFRSSADGCREVLYAGDETVVCTDRRTEMAEGLASHQYLMTATWVRCVNRIRVLLASGSSAQEYVCSFGRLSLACPGHPRLAGRFVEQEWVLRRPARLHPVLSSHGSSSRSRVGQPKCCQASVDTFRRRGDGGAQTTPSNR